MPFSTNCWNDEGVTLPTPLPGLVIRYSYLWHEDHLRGEEEGRKDRPCAIIAAVRTDDKGKLRAIVLPITHSPPEIAEFALEIPPRVKHHLKLDPERSWVICVEWNEFIWPGPDLRRIPNMDDSSIAYGMLPPGFLKLMKERFFALLEKQRAHQVLRTE